MNRRQKAVLLPRRYRLKSGKRLAVWWYNVTDSAGRYRGRRGRHGEALLCRSLNELSEEERRKLSKRLGTGSIEGG